MRLRRTPPPEPALLLLRGVCHELRPPIATLTSLVRALEAQPPEGRREELARLAGEHASHAEAVLRRAAAAAAGLAESTDAAVPLHRVLPVVVAGVPADRLTVSVSTGAARWLVSGRSTRQILLNLLSNAARYSPGQIRLTAAVRLRRLRLTVADQGGLNDDLLRSLRRRTPPPDTNGLGLWVVRRLVAAQGGTLRARASFPSGLAVEVTLPRRRR